MSTSTTWPGPRHTVGRRGYLSVTVGQTFQGCPGATLRRRAPCAPTSAPTRPQRRGFNAAPRTQVQPIRAGSSSSSFPGPAKATNAYNSAPADTYFAPQLAAAAVKDPLVAWLLPLLDEIWRSELQPLLECSVLPFLPPVDLVRHSVAQYSDPTTQGAGLTAQTLYDSVLACAHQSAPRPGVGSEDDRGDARNAVPAVALCVAGAICERVERRLAHTVRLSGRQSGAAWNGDILATAANCQGAGAGASTSSDAGIDDEPETDTDARAAEPLPLTDYLMRLTREQIADLLVSVLGQGADQRENQLGVLDMVGVPGIAWLLEATYGEARSAPQVRRDDTGLARALGGIYFSQLKRLKHKLKAAAAVSAVEELEPMRPYQRDVVGMVLASWGLPLPAELLRSNPWLPVTAQQREEAARYRQQGDGWCGNWLISAPTNSGKTRIFLEVARGVVAAHSGPNPQPGRSGGAATRGVLIVILVPTVILTEQHKAQLDRAELPNTVVRAVNSYTSLSAAEWRLILDEVQRPGGRSHVLVCTGGAFMNLLSSDEVAGGEKAGGGWFGDIWHGAGQVQGQGPGVTAADLVDMLVLDEAHHCSGNHVYKEVVARLRPSQAGLQEDVEDGWGPTHGSVLQRTLAAAASGVASLVPAAFQSGRGPHILAVTASPVSRTTKGALAADMSSLLSLLGARLHVLDPGELPDLGRVLPTPTEREVRVAPRQEERRLVEDLQEFALGVAACAAQDVSSGRGLEPNGDIAVKERQALMQTLFAALAVRRPVGLSRDEATSSRVQQLLQWTSEARNFASRYACARLDLTCRLIDIICKAAELAEDTGYEGVLLYLTRKSAALCREEVRAERRQQAHTSRTGTALLTASLSPEGHGLDARAMGPDAASGAPTPEPRALSGLRAIAGEWAPQTAAARMADEARQAAARGPPAGNTCGDLRVRASYWVAKLLTVPGQGVGPASAFPCSSSSSSAFGAYSVDCTASGDPASPVAHLLVGDGGTNVRRCFAVGNVAAGGFPKFAALVEYLQGYMRRDEFHGVIFVRTRQALFHLSDLLRRTKQLEGVAVHELLGQSTTTNTTTPDCLPGERDRASRGMSGASQMAALKHFKGPGRQLLVATSAAEEGLDVPSCEFVVRYNAAATGVQLVQSRGRARVQQGAEFVAILQESTLDERLHTKSRLEERLMREYQQQYGAQA